MNETPKATNMMRFKHIKFTHILPEHILTAINESQEKRVSSVPVASLKVSFSDDGEPYGVTFRLNNCTLGFYSKNPDSFSQGPFMKLPPEVTAYLSHAADTAIAIVQPIVVLH